MANICECSAFDDTNLKAIIYTNMLVNVLLDTYFREQKCLLILTDSNNFEYTTINIAKVIIRAESEIKPESVFRNYGCQGIIINTRKPVQTFLDFEKKIHYYYYEERFNSRRYLIVHNKDNEEDIKEIFQQTEINFVSDILVVESDYDDTFLLKTHSYIGRYDYNKVVLLDKWYGKNQSFLFNNNLYPEKISNQDGREFRIGSFDYKPYTVVEDGSREGFYGSELTVAEQYALHHKMTPILLVIEGEYWGDVFENWTGTGVLGNLAMDKTDVGAAAIPPVGYQFRFFDFTVPYVRSGITCLVPAPKLAPGWLTPLHPYRPVLWLGFSLVLIINIIVLAIVFYFYQIFDRTTANFANMFGRSLFLTSKIFLLQGLHKKREVSTKFTAKLLMTMQFVFVVFFTSSYSSGLSSTMTVPRYEKAIDSVDDVNSNNLKWGGVDEVWIAAIQQATDSRLTKVVSLFTAQPEEKLRELSMTGHFGLAVERLPKQNFAIEPYVKDDVIHNFHLMKEDIYWTHIIMMMRKNSILLPSFNQFILRAFQADLISVWQNHATALFMDSKVQKAVKYNNYRTNNGLVKLKWTHVEGAFGILVLGYLLSILVFLGEVLKYKFAATFRRSFF